jgi:hypothetical protein
MNDQTEEKGPVLMPLAVSAAAGVGVKMMDTAAHNQLAQDARFTVDIRRGVERVPPAKVVPAELVAAASEALPDQGPLHLQHTTVRVLQEAKIPENLQSIKITKNTGPGSKYVIEFLHGSGYPSILHVDALKGEAAKLMADNAECLIQGEKLQELTKGGPKSWLYKTAIEAEAGVNKAIRATPKWQESIKRTSGFHHMGAVGKTGMIASATVAAIGLVVGIKNMFSGPSSHVARIEAERAEQPQAEAAR